jgi:AcrR family transcriptional regulator
MRCLMTNILGAARWTIFLNLPVRPGAAGISIHKRKPIRNSIPLRFYATRYSNTRPSRAPMYDALMHSTDRATMATKTLTPSRRHKRTLRVPSPDRKGNIKVPAEGWINAAKVALIEEGIAAVKIDRLAQRLKVSRGGFYHHFKNPHAMLEMLLKDWQLNNHFIPATMDTSSVAATLKSFRDLTSNLIHDRGFDPQYDLAIREWARVSQPVTDVVHAVDEQRIEALRRLYAGFGYKPKDALIRARVIYWHQIGYYSIGVQESVGEREKNLSTYLEVLGGEKYVAALLASKKG